MLIDYCTIIVIVYKYWKKANDTVVFPVSLALFGLATLICSLCTPNITMSSQLFHNAPWTFTMCSEINMHSLLNQSSFKDFFSRPKYNGDFELF